MLQNSKNAIFISHWKHQSELFLLENGNTKRATKILTYLNGKFCRLKTFIYDIQQTTYKFFTSDNEGFLTSKGYEFAVIEEEPESTDIIVEE